MNDLTKLEEELHSSEDQIKQQNHYNSFSVILLTILVLICVLLGLGTYFQTKENNLLINQIITEQLELKREINTISTDISMIKTQNTPQEVIK